MEALPPPVITASTSLLSAAMAEPAPGFTPLRFRNQLLGAVSADWLPYLDPEVFGLADEGPNAQRTVRLLGGDRRSAEGLLSSEELNQRLARWAARLHAAGRLPGWRGEVVQLYGSDESAPVLSVERSLLRPLGLLLRSVQVNVYSMVDRRLQIWVGERAATKPVDPGCLDTLVGGGIVGDETPLETLLRECAEEAGIDRVLARRAKPVGIIDSTAAVRDGFATVLHRERLMLYDLKVPADFKPTLVDGEISAAWSLPADAVAHSIATRPWTREGAWSTADLIRRQQRFGQQPED